MIKKGITVILGSFFLLNVLASSRLQKDGAWNQGIHTTLVASRQSILPFESVSVMLVLVNETAEDKRVVTSWCSFLSIGKITASGTNWREYSYLARMGLAFMWLKGVDGKQDQSRAIELLTQVAERAGDPLASSAEYHLGRIEYSGGTSMLERQKKIVKANYHFQRVLNGTPSPYFRYLAEEALRQR